MHTLPPNSAKTIRHQKRRSPAFLAGYESAVHDPDSPSHLDDVIVKRPANRVIVKEKFTAEHKSALLQALQQHSWTTAREAYGWAWSHLGLRVNYITVWRFLSGQGLFTGDTPRARRLAPSAAAGAKRT
jgi:hypothetical protein